MVQEYVSPVRVHKFSFEMVMAAYEMRFPSCPQIPIVVDCVITDDSWSADNSLRETTRRCQLSVEAPYLIKKVIGVDYVYFIQKNHLDLRNRVLDIEATNETFASRVEVVEKCRYFVHPENPEWTCFELTARLDVKNFFGLEHTVEKIAMKQYASNIAKGKELIETFVKELRESGVTELRQWSPVSPDNNLELRQVVSRGIEPLTAPVVIERQHSTTDKLKKFSSTATASSSKRRNVLAVSKKKSAETPPKSKTLLTPQETHRSKIRTLLTPHTKIKTILTPQDTVQSKMKREPSKTISISSLTKIPRSNTSAQNFRSYKKQAIKTRRFSDPGLAKDFPCKKEIPSIRELQQKYNSKASTSAMQPTTASGVPKYKTGLCSRSASANTQEFQKGGSPPGTSQNSLSDSELLLADEMPSDVMLHDELQKLSAKGKVWAKIDRYRRRKRNFKRGMNQNEESTSPRMYTTEAFRPCRCDTEPTTSSLNAWDNLLVMLVCAVAIVVALSVPFHSFSFRRERS